jgi:hypothetical protein
MDESISYEARINLAIKELTEGHFSSVRAAAAEYDVNRRTLQVRMDGTLSRADSTPNSRKLTTSEEQTLVDHILDMDARGFSPRLQDVGDMADLILKERGASPVGRNWPSNFVKRTPSLRSRVRRRYDYQRALAEDPEAIQQWFRLVRNTVNKYGILVEDIYNFDEIGFKMGVLGSANVVTAAERRQAPKAVQPGNREWVTNIQGVNATGWAIPPYIIFKGQKHQASWYQEADIPPNWRLATSPTGWTNNELALDWLHHFNRYSEHRKVGLWRLLILDGHATHNTAEFEKYCEGKKIMPLYMPPHSSHLLQPLDVGCFSVLKRAYENQVDYLRRAHYGHITKAAFLAAFKTAFKTSLISRIITESFRGSGIVPIDSQVVLSRLDVRIRTPTPSTDNDSLLPTQTPRNSTEFKSRAEGVKNRIRRHPSSSPTPYAIAIDTLVRRDERNAVRAALAEAENKRLKAEIEVLTQRKKRKLRYIQNGGAMDYSQGQEIVDSEAIGNQLRREMAEDAPIVVGNVVKKRRCARCGVEGHNSRTCKIDTTVAPTSTTV